MAENVAYVNGEFVADSQCMIHAGDRGIRRGDMVFDTERTFDGKIFRLRDHMERIYRSLAYTRIDPGMTMDEMERLTLDLVELNEPMREPGGDQWVTQIVTRGVTRQLKDQVPATVLIRVYPIDFSEHARHFETGARVVIPRTRSYSSQSLDPKIKHYSRLNFALAELEAADIDPEAYPVLLDEDGNISETTFGNFFLVSGGRIRTPGDRSILQGISRLTVLELAEQMGIPASEEDLQPYDAYTADEAFITSSSMCVLPVARVDDRPMKHGAPGPVVKRLLAAWSEKVGLDIVDQALRYAEARGSR
jgi:branched-chain amino acid aminotransferase